VEQFHTYLRNIDAALHKTAGPSAGDALDWAENDPLTGCPWHFFADGGMNMVHSYFSHNPAFLLNPRTGSTGGAVSARAPSFNYDVDFGPRVALGAINNNGLGVRLSWWLLDNFQTRPQAGGSTALPTTSLSSVPVFGAPGFTSPGRVAQQTGIMNDFFDFDNRVRLQVWDFEGLSNVQGENWGLLFSGGTRYGYLSERYRAFRANTGTRTAGSTRFNLISDNDVVSSGRNFGGVGPTGAVELRRRLGRFGLSLYALGRGSLLFGNGSVKSYQQTLENLQTTVAGRTTTTLVNNVVQASNGSHPTITMADCEAGVDWTLAFGRLLTFARVGLTNETWFHSGSATSSSGDTGFFGLRLTAGFSY
jgi:hypothetical protein